MPTNFTALVPTPEHVRLMSHKHNLTENLNLRGFAKYVPETWIKPADSKFSCLVYCRKLNGGHGMQILNFFQTLLALSMLAGVQFKAKLIQYFF